MEFKRSTGEFSFQARPINPSAYNALIAAGIDPLLARLFAARGVRQAEEINSDLKRLLAPQQLLNADLAARLLANAITQQQRLVIVADYDCDGATACAVGMRGLRALGAQVHYLVPNRFEYGYGLSPEIVQLAAQRFQPDWLITVDNGIASLAGVAAANALGIQVLITDHHLPGDGLPQAACIVNPNQPGCAFPSKNLAGVGVMFYVLLALRAELRARGVFDANTQPKLDHLLDLVALGTVADVVKLDANNRRLVDQGLQRMRSGRLNPGIAALFQVAGREARSATTFDLGFAVGPRLNAAGRLADMSLGIECLISDDPSHAQAIAQQLDAINRERRSIENHMQETALLALEENLHINIDQRATLCLFDETWHQGVIGILASRLKERFHRPTLIFAPSNKSQLRGSGRSIAGLHLRDALDLVSKRHPQLISQFGGHAMAAGLTLRAEHFPAFTQAFENVVQELLDPALLHRSLQHDGALDDQAISLATVHTLQQQVWGQGFAAPIFCDRFIVEQQRVLKNQHLKLMVKKTHDSQATRYEALWFNHVATLPGQVEIAYRLAENHYNGSVRVQLIIEAVQ